MTLSLRVSRARKTYQCDNCGHYIMTGKEYVRRFGSSDDSMRNPRPYMLRICEKCEPLTLVYWHETHGKVNRQFVDMGKPEIPGEVVSK